MKMTDRELIRRALLDAISWRHSLADAWGADTVSGKQAAFEAAQYRDYYTRKYGPLATEDVKARRINAAALRAGIHVFKGEL
jgi:hypothetical protein